MILIVGLGNIGLKYTHTRHNIGFMVVDTLTMDWQEDAKLQALTSKINLDNQEVLLAKPTTMVNSSGEAVGKLAQYYKIAPQDIWVIYDELDLPLGRIKLATDRSDNGHNGLVSISQRLGHNHFWRFKIGVDTRTHREIPGLEYVLQPFADSEQAQLQQSLQQANQAIHLALASGPQTAMQEYNKTASPSKLQETKDSNIQENQ